MSSHMSEESEYSAKFYLFIYLCILVLHFHMFLSIMLPSSHPFKLLLEKVVNAMRHPLQCDN